MSTKIEQVAWGGWPNCYRLSNNEIDLIVTADVGPRVIRLPYGDYDNDATTPNTPLDLATALASDTRQDDAIGGKAYYLGRAELEIPLGSNFKEMGLRPSIFLDVGSLFSITEPNLQDYPNGVQATNDTGQPLYTQVGATEAVTNPIAPDGTPNTPIILPNSAFKEVFLGNTAAPRISAGIGVNWNSPFGPFRIDLAYAIKKSLGDDTKLFSFNVGTAF